ncbi:MAG: hypothetical protein Q8Q01_05320 [archaeon]|nr:hypothetical protein [archaeon]
MMPPMVIPGNSVEEIIEDEIFVEARHFEKERKYYIPEDWYGVCERAILDYTIPGIAINSPKDASELRQFLNNKVGYAISRPDTRQREAEVERLLVLLDTLATITVPHFGEEPYASKLLEIVSRKGTIHDRRIRELQNSLGEATKYWFKCSKEMSNYKALYHRDIARKCHLKSSLETIENRIERMRISLKDIRGGASEIYINNPK